MPALLTMGRKILNAQAFSQFIGVELRKFSLGEAELILPVRPELLQQHGFVHGGVLSFLADNALTFAGGSHFGDALTVEFKINYLKPARGHTLRAIASTLSAGKKLAVVECTLWAEAIDAEPVCCAKAQGTIASVC